MRFHLPGDRIATSATANALKTLMAIIAANTAGHRGRLFRLNIGFAEGTPTDNDVSIQIYRSNNTTPGTVGSTIAAASVPKFDSRSRDTIFTIGLNYSAEPTTLDTYPCFQQDLNSRSGIFFQTEDQDKMIKWDQNQSLCIRATCRANVAVTLSVNGAYEEY